MKTTRKTNEYTMFWETLAKDTANNVPLQRSLAGLEKKLAGANLGKVTRQVLKAVSAGTRLADALRAHTDLFTPAIVTLVSAGEVTGMLDVVFGNIAGGLRNGTFTPPGQKPDPKVDELRFWRGFHMLIGSGVPALSALEAVHDLVATLALKTAAADLRNAIAEGSTLSDAMRKHLETFKPPMCDLIAEGERTGKVDEAIVRLVQALEKGERPAPCAAPTPPAAEASSDDAPVIRAVNTILVEAIRQRASDIHLDLTEDKKPLIRFRIDGVLKEIDPFPEALWPAVLSRIKIMAELDVTQHRQPQDGRFQIKALERNLDMRVSIAPTVLGERICMRLLDRSAIRLEIRNLGLDPDDLEKMLGLVHLPNGIVLCSGPTGSGKTTMLYALLHELNRKENCVMTIEDPVEYTVEGVAQMAVRAADGLTFSRAMRTILRQDPDVIMVGEIRDQETLRISVQAALTGHLVLSTMHTNDAVDTLRRMVDIGLEPFLLNAGLAGVIAQRLVRKLCPKCRQPHDPPRHQLPAEVLAALARNPGATLYRPQGCEACSGGYKGRGAIHEILVMNEPVRRLVGPNMDLREVRRVARQNGMKTLLESGMAKVVQGITSIEEVMRVAPSGPEA